MDCNNYVSSLKYFFGTKLYIQKYRLVATREWYESFTGPERNESDIVRGHGGF